MYIDIEYTLLGVLYETEACGKICRCFVIILKYVHKRMSHIPQTAVTGNTIFYAVHVHYIKSHDQYHLQ
jgi:hypothetical protein